MKTNWFIFKTNPPNIFSKTKFISQIGSGLKQCSIAGLSTVLLASTVLTGCSAPKTKESQTMTGTYFDTVVQIEVWGADSEMMDHCKELCENYEQLLSTTIETSEVSKINQAAGQPVTVSDETANLIQKGIEYGDLSGGKFDITIASASDLWDFHDNNNGTIPAEEQLKEAASHINYKNIELENNTVTLKDPEAKIDLGGIAKGYIADKLKEYLKSEGIEHAWINLGGNVLTLGGKPDGSSFRIGLQKPFSQSGEILGILPVSDQSIVTSGNYERYFEKDGVLYHHILDPSTGYPVQNNLYQVTIISDQSVDGDALSTTCYALGLEEGMKLIQSLDGLEAIFVTDDYTIHKSSDDINLTET